MTGLPTEVPVWVLLVVALIAGTPGIIAAVLARRTSQVSQKQDHLAKAAEGFAELVDALQLQIDRERQECTARIERLTTDNQDEVRRIRTEYEERISVLTSAKNIIEKGLE